MQEDRAPSAGELARWRGLVQNIRREFSGSPEPPPVLPSETTPSSARKEILIVEHDPTLLDTLVGLAEGEGLSVRLATSRSEAVRIIDQAVPEALIVDIELPDGSGYELIEHLRSFPPARRSAILALSDEMVFLARLEALRCGADACLPKPIDEATAGRQLRQLVRVHKEGPGRILGIQGSPSHVVRVQELLTSAGYEMRLCDDVANIEAVAVEFRPDLFLIDGVLAGLSGSDVVRFLRQDERHAALPALVLGDKAPLGARVQMATAGVDEYLPMPGDPELLLATIATRIERGRLSRGLVNRDGLTGAATYQAFLGHARVAVAQKRRSEERSYAWLAIDVDGFRKLNDRHGHVVGDRVLVCLATLLIDRLREEDRVARFGDDEFAVLLKNLQPDDAHRLATRLAEEFSAIEHRGLERTTFRSSMSVGVAWLDKGMSVDGWHRAAQDALEKAKQLGGGGVSRRRADRRT
jgi:diguanylate cyclase (GGDEF)-like protein